MKKSVFIWIIALGILIGGGLYYRRVAQEVDSRGATRLMRALEENDTEKTIRLLESGTDIHVQDKTGKTALFYAARQTQDPILLYKLIAAGANPLAKDKKGNTPLMIAAQYNTSAKVVMALAKQGGLSAEQTANKNRALQIAARNNQAAIIKALLIAHASPTFEEQNAAELLAANEQLSEQEKADFRQVMLLLEILEAREQVKQYLLQSTPAEKQKPAKTVPTLKQMAPQKVAPSNKAVDPTASSRKAVEPTVPVRKAAEPATPSRKTAEPTVPETPLAPAAFSAAPLAPAADLSKETSADTSTQK